MRDISKVVCDMAKSNGVGRLIVGPNVIPVKVTNIKRENTIDSTNTEFECTVVDSSALYVDTDSLCPGINSVYGMMGGRFNGKSYDEYQMMKDKLRKGCKLVPVGTCGAWTAMDYRATDKKSGERPWGWGVPGIDRVIFSNPATIVFWTDGEKTVVKAQNGEPYDPEQFNSEICHIDKYEELWEEHRAELACSDNALAALISAVNDKKATKAEILNAVNEAIKWLKIDEKETK